MYNNETEKIVENKAKTKLNKAKLKDLKSKC